MVAIIFGYSKIYIQWKIQNKKIPGLNNNELHARYIMTVIINNGNGLLQKSENKILAKNLTLMALRVLRAGKQDIFESADSFRAIFILVDLHHFHILSCQ